MWLKWFPWRFLVRDAARRRGFLDPIKILSQLQNFAQPSEVAAPTELLRSGVVLHARGLMNSLAIQHNLDWIWPYWVECQYDPRNPAFIPRAFSLTQINLTHRNWTALGVPDCSDFPIVDPRGLITPHYDSWSIDAWIIPDNGDPLLPSRSPDVSQELKIDEGLCVVTETNQDKLQLRLEAKVIGSHQDPICQIKILGSASQKARLAVSIRPYNPEGVSLINNISSLKESPGLCVNKNNFIYFNKPPEKILFSYYQRGDVYSCLPTGQAGLHLKEDEKEIYCKVGMATAAALYVMEAEQTIEIILSVPLEKSKFEKEPGCEHQITAQQLWKQSLKDVCSLHIPDKHFKFLYDAAIRTMILHSPEEVYPGPFIYRRFWFRDAAFILNAMLSVGLKERVKRALDCFPKRQTVNGYFLSQEGEWDSNGEALWIMSQYCKKTGTVPPLEWKRSIIKAGKWIYKKILPCNLGFPHEGLMPSGFSAEHLGPNDFYYWDDFWAVAGLTEAAFLCSLYSENDKVDIFVKESEHLKTSIDKSLKKVEERLRRPAIPASPYRRLDTGAIGSLVVSYPLGLFDPNDKRMLDTVDFLMKKCLLNGGFFHDMTHSGINPYLTLHMAQVLLRAGDKRYFDLMTEVARLASSTGQWPEAIHTHTNGGCMGDGQHVWAAAEWVLMIRNCFLREENDRLILCSGIPQTWLEKNETISFGPAPTSFGDVQILVKPKGKSILVEWVGQWFTKGPLIDIQLPGFIRVEVSSGANFAELKEMIKE